MGKLSSILDHDVVFWFGDLNFRLDAKTYSPREIIECIGQNRTKQFKAVDELTHLCTGNLVFSGFSECAIDFNPTFKFIPNSKEVYDEK